MTVLIRFGSLLDLVVGALKGGVMPSLCLGKKFKLLFIRGEVDTWNYSSLLSCIG